jgi:putative endonuclease
MRSFVVNAPSSQVWFVYLLECENGRLYTGITPDLAERFRKHATGKGAMFTRLNKPSRMIAATPCVDRSEASKLEHTIKGLTPPQKRWMAGRWPMQQGLPCNAPPVA